MIDLQSRYDPALKDLLAKKEDNIKYLSPSIQNELIQLLSRAVHDDIVDDIKNADFYSIITDTTQDVCKIDQLSQIFRYVEITESVGIEIKESFLGFIDVHDHSAVQPRHEIN